MEITGAVSSILNQKAGAVWSISPDATVFEAIEKMSQKNVGALPVMSGEKLLGVISERDYTRKVMLLGKSSKTTPVREIMSREPVTARPGDPIGACMALMTEKRVRHLPIMDGQTLVGILSMGDLVRWTLSAQAATIEHLERYITGEYPT